MTVNCPKCGYSQEDRLDCKRCGIVFSKYYALHLAGKAVPAENSDPAIQQYGVGENVSADVAELRQTVRDLNRRYSEVEFERAERHRLREEIRGLDQKLNQSEVGLSSRLSELEKQTSQILDRPPGATREDLSELKNALSASQDLLFGKIEEIEAKLDNVAKEQVAKPDPRVLETLRKFEQRILELEAGVVRMAEDKKNPDAEAAFKDLADLRAALQNVTIRYSEIGELKKNHLFLLNKVETLQREVDSMKNGASRPVCEKMREMEMEVLALRAEVRQILKHMEALEAAPQITGEEVLAMKEEIESATRRMADLGADGALLRAEVNQMQEHLQILSEYSKNLVRPVPEASRAPLEEDVRAIRENLQEIRSFMHSLSKKL